MKFYIIFILFLTQLNCGFSKEKHIENVRFFDEFVEDLLKSQHKMGKATISLDDAAKMLDSVEKNIAKKILEKRDSKMEIDEIYPNLHAICHNDIMQKLATPDDKVQFLMLLLSFATRLAFTIGSEALEKHGFKIQMNSFVLAYKHLEKEFPIEEQFKEIEYKFRFYQGASLQMNSDLTSVSFLFSTANEDQQKQRKYNFDTIHFYSTEWMAVRLLELLGKLQKCSKTQEGEQHKMHFYNRGEYTDILDRLMVSCNGPSETENDYFYKFNPLSLFVMKNFAANLIKLLLRKKHDSKEAAAYFEEYPHIEFELNRILAELHSYLEENQNDFLINNDILLHYEDAVAMKINWSTKEGYISLKSKISAKIQKWKDSFENCRIRKIEENKLHCDPNKIMKEIENERNAYESLYMIAPNYNHLPLFYELKEFQKEDGKINTMNFDKISIMGKNNYKEVWESGKKDVLKKMDELINKVPKCIEEFEKVSKEEHIMNILFNQFIKSALDIPENEYKKATISVEKCAKLLELVEKIAHRIDEKIEAMAIDHIFKEIFSEFIKSEQKDVIKNMEQQLHKKLNKPENKVQFLMLHLSFATRLAFTIGSEALEKHGFKIQMNSFVLAYKHLENEFPAFVEEENYKLRSYQAAILRIINEESVENTAVLLDFTMLDEGKQQRRKDNLDAIYGFLKENKKENTVKDLHWNMDRIVSYKDNLYDKFQYHTAYRKFFNLLYKMDHNKNQYAQIHKFFGTYKKENVFAMKHFAAKLGKRMLRMKEHNAEAKRYFEKMEGAEQRIIHSVKQLEEKLAEYSNDVYKKPYFFEHEILMHYEEAVQIDWRTTEDVLEQVAKMRALYAKWEKIIQDCNVIMSQVTGCKLDEIEEEMEKNKGLFEGFYLRQSFNEILTKLKTCKEHKKGKNAYYGKEVTNILAEWKTNIEEMNKFHQFKVKVEDEIKSMIFAVAENASSLVGI